MKVFTPRNVSSQLKEQRKSKEPKRVEKTESRSSSRSSGVTVEVNAGDVVSTFWSIFEHYDRRKRSKQRARRDVLKSKVLHLAEYYQGIVGVPDLLMHDWCDREEANNCFQDLQAQGHCHFFTTYHDEDLYVFPELVIRVWNCDYCSSQFAARKSDTPSDVCLCSNCGSQLQLTVA
jgi:hypothetical protein